MGDRGREWETRVVLAVRIYKNTSSFCGINVQMGYVVWIIILDGMSHKKETTALGIISMDQ